MSSNKKFMVKITPKNPQGDDGLASALKPSITFDMSKPFRVIAIRPVMRK